MCKIFDWNNYKTYPLSLSPLKQLSTISKSRKPKAKNQNRIQGPSKTILHEVSVWLVFFIFSSRNTFQKLNQAQLYITKHNFILILALPCVLVPTAATPCMGLACLSMHENWAELGGSAPNGFVCVPSKVRWIARVHPRHRSYIRLSLHKLSVRLPGRGAPMCLSHSRGSASDMFVISSRPAAGSAYGLLTQVSFPHSKC
jgi:hypothetical protein